LGARRHSSTRSNRGDMASEYYDVNDFLAREHAVTVEFEDGASSLGPEVMGTRAQISNSTTPRGDEDDVPREHIARVPVWWLDGELCRDLLIQEPPEAFSDEVFNALEAENGAKILDLRRVNESYFGFAKCALAALTKQNQGDEDAMENVRELREKIYRAYQKRWREALCESTGRLSDESAKLERLLTREEREVWDAGREARRAYEEYRYGRGGRVVANKIVTDAKRRRT
jgi:GINS complex subunit 3